MSTTLALGGVLLAVLGVGLWRLLYYVKKSERIEGDAAKQELGATKRREIRMSRPIVTGRERLERMRKRLEARRRQ